MVVAAADPRGLCVAAFDNLELVVEELHRVAIDRQYRSVGAMSLYDDAMVRFPIDCSQLSALPGLAALSRGSDHTRS